MSYSTFRIKYNKPWYKRQVKAITKKVSDNDFDCIRINTTYDLRKVVRFFKENLPKRNIYTEYIAVYKTVNGDQYLIPFIFSNKTFNNKIHYAYLLDLMYEIFNRRGDLEYSFKLIDIGPIKSSNIIPSFIECAKNTIFYDDIDIKIEDTKYKEYHAKDITISRTLKK